MDRPFKIDHEFSSLIPPASAEEIALLTESVKRDGILHPLVVWKEEKVLLDGHTRYKLAVKMSIPHPVKHLSFKSRAEARNWLINHQLGRRNISAEQRTYLLGKLYNEQKQDHGGQLEGSGKSYHSVKTAEKIAESNRVSEKTVRNAGQFAAAVDTLDKDSPGLAKAVLAGESQATAKDIIGAVSLPLKQRKKAAKQIAAGKKPEVDKPRPSGKQLRDPRKWEQIESLYGQLTRAVDNANKDFPHGNLWRQAQKQLNEFHATIREWKQNMHRKAG